MNIVHDQHGELLFFELAKAAERGASENLVPKLARVFEEIVPEVDTLGIFWI